MTLQMLSFSLLGLVVIAPLLSGCLIARRYSPTRRGRLAYFVSIVMLFFCIGLLATLIRIANLNPLLNLLLLVLQWCAVPWLSCQRATDAQASLYWARLSAVAAIGPICILVLLFLRPKAAPVIGGSVMEDIDAHAMHAAALSHSDESDHTASGPAPH